MPEDFTAYVAARGQALWRTAWLLTGDAAMAEDLVQTALAKAWPHFDRVSRGGSFEAYVRRTMVTTYATWRGRRWHGEVPTAAPPEGPAAPTTSDLDLLRALSGLSPRQRAVVVLRYFEDLTESDTAAVLGCSVGSVKTHHARAMAQLRASRLLSDELPEEVR